MRAKSTARLTAWLVVFLAAAGGVIAATSLAYANWLSAFGGRTALENAIRWSNSELIGRQGHDAADAKLLAMATRMQPRLSQSWIELSVAEEMRGDYDASLRALQSAIKYDAGFRPRWAMANFHLRRNQLAEFWHWAKQCALIPYAQYGALVDVCLRVDAGGAFQRIGPGDERLHRQFVDSAMVRNQIPAGRLAGYKLASAAHKQDRDRLLAFCDRCLAQGDYSTASGIWRLMAQNQLLREMDLALPPGNLLNDPMFASSPEGRGFDWRLYSREGADVIANKGLLVILSGGQRESVVLAEQHVETSAGALLNMEVETGSIDIEGLDWLVYPLNDWSRPLCVLSVRAPGRSEVGFRTAADVHLIRVILRYQRPTGSVRAKGEARFIEVRLRRLHS